MVVRFQTAGRFGHLCDICGELHCKDRREAYLLEEVRLNVQEELQKFMQRLTVRQYRLDLALVSLLKLDKWSSSKRRECHVEWHNRESPEPIFQVFMISSWSRIGQVNADVVIIELGDFEAYFRLSPS